MHSQLYCPPRLAEYEGQNSAVRPALIGKHNLNFFVHAMLIRYGCYKI